MTETPHQITASAGINDDPPFPPTDGMVATLARALNASPGGQLGLTVSVAGSLISGVAVGRDDWMEAYATNYANHPAGEAVSKLFEHFTLAVANEKFPDFEENFLHLTDARYLNGIANVPSAGGILTRIRLDKIDSWSLTFFGLRDEENELLGG